MHSYLEHELCDHSVELGALVAKALLPCTQGPEVFCSPWDNLVVEFKLNPAKGASIHINIEVDLSPASLTCKAWFYIQIWNGPWLTQIGACMDHRQQD